MNYRADIDGLRAIAVMPVLLFHCGLASFSGGYVGVDIFFVISGYIIARSLHEDLQQGRFSILDFYQRRILRIFPALVFTVLLTFLGAVFILMPADFTDFSRSLSATFEFTANFYFWKHSGYFENSALLRPLLHMWSLSVEEQFYIFMPFVMLVIFRYLHRRWALYLLLAIAASFALSVYATKVGPTANFFLLPTRAWELLLGAVIALSPPPAIKQRWINEALGALGLGLIAYAIFTYTAATPFPGPYAVLPCVGAALIIYVGCSDRTLVGTVLSQRPFVAVGLISYSLYLVHWPIMVYARYELLNAPNMPQIVAIVIASFLLAIVSWRYIEQPFRKLRYRVSRRRVLIAGVITIILGILLGTIGTATNGLAGRFPGYVPLPTATSRETVWHNGTCFFEEGEGDSYTRWNAKNCDLTGHGKQTVLLWGDSYAAHYIPGIQQLAKKIPYRVLVYTSAGCPPVLSYTSYSLPQCHAANQHALDIIEKENVTRVILSARWTDLQLRGLGTLRSTLDELAKRGIETYIVAQSPMFAMNVHVIAYRKGRDGSNGWINSIDADLNQRLRDENGITANFIDPTALLCEGNTCPYRQDGEFIYSDSGHFSSMGSTKAVAAYLPLFK